MKIEYLRLDFYVASTFSSGCDMVENVETESQRLDFKSGNRVSETRFQIGYILKLTPHSLTHYLCHIDQVSPSPSHASAHLSLTLFSHSIITLLTTPITHPLRQSSSLTHPFLLLRQTLTTSLIILFTNHPLSLTLFSHSVKRSSLRRSPSSLIQSI